MYEKLLFSRWRRLPLVLQAEVTECSLACLAMISGYYGGRESLGSLRDRYPASPSGTNLAAVMQVAEKLGLATRAVRIELDQLALLRLPCILHWDLNHFVVLKRVGKHHIDIHDPASGLRRIALSEVSSSLTGVALEVWANEQLTPGSSKGGSLFRSLVNDAPGIRSMLLTSLGMAFVIEALMLASPWFLQFVIDFDGAGANVELLAKLAIGFGFIVLLQQCLTAVRGWLILKTSAALNMEWRSNIFRHLLQLPATYFERRHFGDVVSRFGAVDEIQKAVTVSLVEAVLDGAMALLTLAAMFACGGALAWIALGAAGIYTGIRAATNARLSRAAAEEVVHAAHQHSNFLETIRAARTVKLFQREQQRRGAWATHFARQLNARLDIAQIQLSARLSSGILIGLGSVATVWAGATGNAGESISAGALVTLIAYKMQFDNRITALVDKMADMRLLRVHFDRVSDIVDAQPEPDARAQVQGVASTSVVLRNVRFRYHASLPFVLDGVTLDVRQGECVAVVGPSGCGKSTLLGLIAGLHAPESGTVEIGGVDATQLGNAQRRSLIGTVFQEDHLFEGSIAENISCFDDATDMAWVEEVARMASVHEDIQAMPMRYRSRVGDMGSALSGGQKQRILLARALYKRPGILLLDEATSHLDARRESAVNKAVRDLAITRIIVAHRRETIASADRVIAIAGGRIALDGPAAVETPCGVGERG